MTNKFKELVKYVNENKVYINASEFYENEYILMAFRHATTETNLELFNLCFDLIKEMELDLGSNEHWMFEWLVDRQLKSKGNNAIELLDIYITDPYFLINNMRLDIARPIFYELKQLSERNLIDYIEPILSNKSILNYLFNYDKKEFLDICNSQTELNKYKTIFTINNF